MSTVTAIGIDLGTSYTCAGFMRQGNFQIIELASSRKTLNYVAFKKNGREIGDNLKLKIRMNYKHTVFDSKGILFFSLISMFSFYLIISIVFIGSKFDEKSFSSNQKYPFKIISDNNNKYQFEIDKDNVFYPEEITAIVLNNLKEYAEKQIGSKIEKAVVSVPACFNDSQRQSTIDAAKIAGFKNIHLLNDTTAAAIAYAYEKNIEGEKRMMIFDLGGHYLNLSIVNIKNGIIEVQSAASYPNLGGQIFDYRMAEYLEDKIKNDSSVKYLQNMKAFQSLLVECEKAKKNLSNCLESFLEISFDDDEDFSYKFTRDLFENLNKDLFTSIIKHVDDFIGDLQLKISDIGEVLLIGGSSRIPKLQFMLSDLFEGKKLNNTMNASETVVYGTAIQAAALTGNKLKYNNGFKYVDLINSNYCLKILNNRNEELFDIFMPSKTQLSTTQFSSIKKALLKNKIILEFKENNNTLNTLDIDCSDLNQVDIKFNIDVNSILSINLVLYGLNNFQKSEKIMQTKVDCITNDQIEKLKDNHKNYLKLMNENNKKLTLKNKFETKCYDLKNKIALKNKQKSRKYSEIEKDINKVIEYLKSSDKIDLIQVDDCIGEIMEIFYRLNFKLELEIKLKAIEIKLNDFKNEIASKDELKSGVYSNIEKDIEKFLEIIKSKFEAEFIKKDTFLSQKFEKMKNYRDKHKHEKNLLMNYENFGEYSTIEKEIDILFENLLSDLHKEEINVEDFINSKKNDLIDLQHKAKLMEEINQDFEILINSIKLDEKLGNQIQNNNIIENLELYATITSEAIKVQASEILDSLKKKDNFKIYFKNVEKSLSELLNDTKKKDPHCIKSSVEQLKKLKLEFLLITEQTNIENRNLKDIGNMFDSWYSMHKLVSIEFVTGLFKIIKNRENNQISIDDFCQYIEKYFQENIGLFCNTKHNIDNMKSNLKNKLDEYKNSSF